MIRKETGEVHLGFPCYRISVQRDREIMPHHDSLFHFASRDDKLIKMRVEFGRPTSDIERPDSFKSQDFQTALHGTSIHLFSSLGRGIDMAMPTGLIAQFGYIDLERLNRNRLNTKQMVLQNPLKIVFLLAIRLDYRQLY